MARLPYIIPYDPGFLGGGFSVPLPKTQSNDAGRALKRMLVRDGAVYDYIHFSLVMHEERRQALFTGCNLDGDDQKSVARGDWSIDSRLSAYQIGNEAYRNNEWERGHLVRRQDVCWGTRRRAKDASDSTFYYTNAAFQHENFNGDEWNQLEDWVLERVTEATSRICVLTGQFLTPDDPLATVNPGVRARIPTAFWKVIALRDPTNDGEDLTAAAFIIPQSEDFIRTVVGDDEPWSKDQLRTFQVEIADLEQLSRLDFGDLRNVDDFPWSAVRFRSDKMWRTWRPIEEPKDIAIGGARRRRIGGGRAIRVMKGYVPTPATLVSDPPMVDPKQVASEVARVRAVEPEVTEHECGCGDSNTLERRIEKLNAKIEQLSDVLQMYAEDKMKEADEVTEKLEDAIENPKEGGPVRLKVSSLDKGGDAMYSGSGGPAGTALDALATQVRRDGERAARLLRNASRIVGGMSANVGEFPSAVLIGDDSGYYCTGVLISKRAVLTAAHCGRDTTHVLLGVVDQSQSLLGTAQHRYVIRAVRHPRYKQTRLPWNDLMVLILDDDVTDSDKVKTIPFVEISSLKDIGDVVIVGYGNNDFASTRGFGRQRKATVAMTNTFEGGPYTPDQIREAERIKGFSAPHEFFAGMNDSGIDTCEGDSGGPVYAEIDGKWRLLGITSRPALEGDNICGDGGLYTSVPAYASWIHETLGSDSV